MSRARPLIVAALLAGSALTAHGDVPADFAEWARGPVRWLMQADEMLSWTAVSSEAEAEAWKARFWARRDPSPGTDRNENREQFETLVDIADERFGAPKLRGAMSDRGRVLLLLGPPYRIERSLPEQSVQGLSGLRGDAPSIIWHYEKDRRLDWAGKQNVEVHFSDYRGRNEYELILGSSRDIDALLGAAANRYLTTATNEVSLPWSNLLKREMANPSDSQTPFWSDAYVASDGSTFVALDLGTFASPGSQIAGLVLDAQGQVITQFREPFVGVKEKGGIRILHSIPLAPGTYRAVFGIGEDPLTARITSGFIEVPDFTRSGFVSRLILAESVAPMDTAQRPMEPFAFGGLRIVPHNGEAFSRDAEIFYFVELRDPQESHENLVTDVTVEISGETAAGEPVLMRAPLGRTVPDPVKGLAGHSLIGGSLPAGVLEPGSYRARIEIEDAATGEKWTRSASFVVD